MWIDPPLKKKWETGYYSFQILKIKKWERGSIFFKNFAALRAGFYSFQKCCGGVLFLRNLRFVFSSILHCKPQKVVKILKKIRRASRGSQYSLGFQLESASGAALLYSRVWDSAKIEMFVSLPLFIILKMNKFAFRRRNPLPLVPGNQFIGVKRPPGTCRGFPPFLSDITVCLCLVIWS